MPRRDVHNELVAALVVLGVLALLLAAGAIFDLSLNGSAVSATASAPHVAVIGTSVTGGTGGTGGATTRIATIPPAGGTGTSSAIRPTRSTSASPSVTGSAIGAQVEANAAIAITGSATATATTTPSPTLTLTASLTRSPTRSATPHPTTTITSTASPTISPTATITSTLTDTVTSSPTATPSDTPSDTPTDTPSITPSPTASATETPSASPTSTWTPLPTIPPPPSHTPTSIPFATSLPTINPTNNPSASPTLSPSAISGTITACAPPIGWLPYLVQPGDTLFLLALRANVSIGTLETGNCLTDPNQLRAGQILYFPPGTILSATGSPSPTPPTAISGYGCADPATRISAPASGSTLTTPFTIRGAASIPAFSAYKLEISTPGSGGQYKTFAVGTTPIAGDGVLGTLDPAPYVQGSGAGTYYIHLIVINTSFQVAPNTCTIYVRFAAP